MCHLMEMSTAESLDPALFSRLVDNLYVEAMVMADEARFCFDRKAVEDRDGADMVTRLSFTCESLKVTTRLMHVIAWLLTQKACRRGEIPVAALDEARYRLGQAAPSDSAALAAMPSCARDLVTGSESLYERVRRLQDSMGRARATAPRDGPPEAVPRAAAPEGAAPIAAAIAGPGPARDLLARLEEAF